MEARPGLPFHETPVPGLPNQWIKLGSDDWIDFNMARFIGRFTYENWCFSYELCQVWSMTSGYVHTHGEELEICLLVANMDLKMRI